MCSPFSCSRFKNQERDDLDEFLSPCGSPNRSKSVGDHHHYTKRRDGKNPYANQGLDKFYALLAELEEKKKKIYTQKDSKDISFIYFTTSNSSGGEWKPIIVKAPKRQENTTPKSAKGKQIHAITTSEASRTVDSDQIRREKEEVIKRPETKSKNWRQSFGYLPVTIVLILLFLVIYGKSFAILCTTVGWYVVPMAKDNNSNSERQKKKNIGHSVSMLKGKNSSTADQTPKKKIDNGHARRLSESNIINVNIDHGSSSSPPSSSPKSVLCGPEEQKRPKFQCHRKSWS